MGPPGGGGKAAAEAALHGGGSGSGCGGALASMAAETYTSESARSDATGVIGAGWCDTTVGVWRLALGSSRVSGAAGKRRVPDASAMGGPERVVVAAKYAFDGPCWGSAELGSTGTACSNEGWGDDACTAEDVAVAAPGVGVVQTATDVTEPIRTAATLASPSFAGPVGVAPLSTAMLYMAPRWWSTPPSGRGLDELDELLLPDGLELLPDELLPENSGSTG